LIPLWIETVKGRCIVIQLIAQNDHQIPFFVVGCHFHHLGAVKI
jgi:hypothetical protein